MIQEQLKREDATAYSLSNFELERRWKAVRERMADRKIDFLVIQTQQRYNGGYFRWFTDYAWGGNYHVTAIFPLKDEMAIITHGAPAPAKASSPPIDELRGVKERFNTLTMPNVYWENPLDAEAAVAFMMKKKPKTVGLVGLGNMSASIYENLKKGLTGVNVVDASDLVDEVRMVKSEEELKLHRDAAYLHEKSYEYAKTVIKPGKSAWDVTQEIRIMQLLEGSEEQQIALTYGRPDGPKYMQMNLGSSRVRRPLANGDIISFFLMEVSAPGGYWYDMVRVLGIGDVPKSGIDAYEEAYGIVKEARAILAKNLKPGLSVNVALDASDAFLKSKGCPPEARMGGHGQGLDLAERPIINRNEPAKLEVGMVLSIHPAAITKYARATISDTFVITEDGAVPIYENLFNNNKLEIVG